jgi:hypothetical protein
VVASTRLLAQGYAWLRDDIAVVAAHQPPPDREAGFMQAETGAGAGAPSDDAQSLWAHVAPQRRAEP